MKKTISTVFSFATLGCSIAYYVATNHMETLTETTNWILNKPSFNIVFYGFFAYLGLIILTSTKQDQFLAKNLRKLSKLITKSYLSSIGFASGWLVGVVAFAISHDTEKYLTTATILIFQTITLIALPTITIKLITKYEKTPEFINNIKTCKIKHTEKLTGLFVVLLSIFGFLYIR